MLKKFFNLSNVFATIFTFAFLFAIERLGVQFEFMNVFGSVFNDFELTDIYYSKFQTPEEAPYDDRIVLVNIGDLPRDGIAAQINILSKFKPKVIGIDARFLKDKEPAVDSALSAAIKNAGNVVLASELVNFNDTTSKWDIKYSRPQFSDYAKSGFVNVVAKEKDGHFRTWRMFTDNEKLKKGGEEIFFPLQILKLYDSTKVAKCLARNNENEHIYYKGNLGKYLKLDVDDVFKESFTKEALEGKIVLMGYMGGDYTSPYWDDDKFFTPLNEAMVGRGAPDMYGVVVHANIVSMLLDENYINVMSGWASALWAIGLCFLNVALFSYVKRYSDYDIWYDVITKGIQLTQIILINFCVIYFFAEFKYMLELNIASVVIVLSGDLLDIYFAVFFTSYERLLLKWKKRAKQIEE